MKKKEINGMTASVVM